jgi:hypothetical protein
MDINVHDNVALMLDVVELGFTPKFVSVFDFLVGLESVVLNDIVVEQGMSLEWIEVSEYVRVAKMITFNDILRTYPFVVHVLSRVEGVEFENGVVQERDLWGRVMRQFEVNFPPLTRTEALDVQDFFIQNKGKVFSFTNPVDGIAYNVRIVDKDFILERRYFNTYYSKMVVEEVFS